MKRSVRLLLSLSLVLAAAGVRAADVTVSGFGTLGYAISDKPYSYQRYIDEQGTFDRDSRLAVQVDAALSRRWSATAQLKFAPDEDSDSRWAPRLSWGFLSWRPDDDWLLRVGKLRPRSRQLAFGLTPLRERARSLVELRPEFRLRVALRGERLLGGPEGGFHFVQLGGSTFRDRRSGQQFLILRREFVVPLREFGYGLLLTPRPFCL